MYGYSDLVTVGPPKTQRLETMGNGYFTVSVTLRVNNLSSN